jgi:hypothetical protein
MTLGHRDLLSRALPYLYEGRSEAKKLFAGRSERRSTFIPNEERASQLFLKEPHAGAHCRLRDVQTIGGFDEAAGGDDLYEGPGKFDVHVSSNIISAHKS